MPEAKSDTKAKVDTSARDRVVALSVNKDGSLDQTNPEIIGDRAAAVAAAREQFAQIAVSALDEATQRDERAAEAEAAKATVDPKVKEYEAAAEAGANKGEALIKALS